MEQGHAPDTIGGSTDPGAEVQRRFRYQDTYAAILAIGLFYPENELVEVYCEQHEDILCKRGDGTFIGIQVKTRDVNRGPFRAGDPEMMSAIGRFAGLERDFDGKFFRFVIATNAGFWDARQTSSNLPHLVSLAKEAVGAVSVETTATLSRFLRRVARQTGVQEDVVHAALCRVELRGDLPTIHDVETRLVKHLGDLVRLKGQRYDSIQRIAEALVGYAFRAASLANESGLRDYFQFCSDPAGLANRASISSKCMTAETIERIMDDAIAQEGSLRTWNHISLADLPQGMRTTELKMAAGGLSVADVDLARDHRDSAEVLLREWFYKYGRAAADGRYEHLRTIAKTECQEAYDSVYDSGTVFGPEMLAEVRRRIRERYDRGRNGMFGCEYEHLMGLVGILTEDCTVWWSGKFDIPRE